MISHFYQELVKMSIDVRATKQLSRATSPGIKLLSASKKAKNLNPTFQVSQSNPKPTLHCWFLIGKIRHRFTN